MPIYAGGCHCGEVRFEVNAEEPIEALTDCNCSICTKKGILHLAVEDSCFEIRSGEDHLSLYQFRSNTARHWFCRTCGIHTFGRPRNHPTRYTVNARCLDDFEQIRAGVKINRFDGQHHPKDQ